MQMTNKETARHYTHGLTGTRVYKTWESMKSRCYNENDGKYDKYGGRGIRVCDEWLGKYGAKNFAEWAYKNGFDERKKQKEQSIDRIDVDGNYEPSNCRFVNAKTQANNKTNTVYIEYNGERKSLQEWSELTGIKESTIRWRINNGYSTEKALTEKVKAVKRSGKRYIRYNGKDQTISEWANELGMPVKVLYARLQRGWDIKRAFETPVGYDKWHKTK